MKGGDLALITSGLKCIKKFDCKTQLLIKSVDFNGLSEEIRNYFWMKNQNRWLHGPRHDRKQMRMFFLLKYTIEVTFTFTKSGLRRNLSPIKPKFVLGTF